jgi:tripartite-type tricarboxylate transporter receptor subunit TctC
VKVSAWIVRATVLAAVSCGLAGPAAAQSYPSKPIRWMLGFPAGGTSDILARAIGMKLTEALGQQIVIDNRAGASGIIANELAAKAPPDGYTMLLVSSTYANLISMGKKLPYDPEHDLIPVTRLASVPNILSTHPSLPVRSVKELIALARAKPGQINFGTGGTGTGPHLATELFRLTTRIDIVHVPYKGTPPAVNDLLAGRMQVMFALSPVAMPHVKADKLRSIAVSGSKRLPELPQVPTVAETVPGYEATTWYGLLMQRGTPTPIIEKLNAEFNRILTMKDIVERMAAAGFQPDGSSPDEFGRFIKAEVAKWSKVIREANIPID